VTYNFKRGTAIAGLTLCAAFGATLAGCNGGAGGAGGGDSLATVGGTKITRTDLTSFLEAQQGEQVLPYLIDTQLIMESLKAKELDVTDEEVQADLTRRQANDPSVKALVDAGGVKLESAKNQIKRDLAMQKLLTADIKPTEAQIKSFFDKNRKYYDAPAKAKVGILFTSTKARADLMARQLKDKTRTFEALVEEQKKANDPAAGQSTAVRPTFESVDNFGPTMAPLINKLPKGGTTPPQELNVGMPTPIYVIFKKVDFQPAAKADLVKMRAQIETDYKLSEVARKTAAANPQNPPFDETLTRTQQYLASQNPGGPQPQLRDVLSFINQTAANELLSKMRSSGSVQIDDPTYAKIGEGYKAAPAAGATPGAGAPAGATAPGAPAAAANAAPAPAKQ
jgi:hypothetical protein